MKTTRIFLAATLWLGLAIGLANAQSISIDERFDDDSPFTDLNFAYGNNIPSSATIQGLNVFRASPAQDPAKLGFIDTSGNLQGTLVTLPHKARVWQLNPGEHIFMGQSNSPSAPSGDGQFGADGDGISIAQLGIALLPGSLFSSNTLLGSVSYLFGSATTYTLTYNLVRSLNGFTADVVPIRNGVAGQSLGIILPAKFSLITTVWASQGDDSAADQKWITFPKTRYGDYRYTATDGSADGRLYPKGKGWPNGTRLTSSTLGTCVYSYLDTKPDSYGTTLSMPALKDNPWVLDGVFGPEAARLRTWRIEATSVTLYVDDLYHEARVRAGLTSASAAADYRLHEFDQTLRYGPTSTTLRPNAQYFSSQWDMDMGVDVPVELSLFEVR